MLTSLKEYCVGTLSGENVSKPEQYGSNYFNLSEKARKLNVIRIYMQYVAAVVDFHVFANRKNTKHLNGNKSHFYFTTFL